MEHVGVVVDDLAAATAFFAELGLEPQSEGSVDGAWVGRVVGLEGVRVDYAMMDTPDGDGRIELVKFHAPPGAPATRTPLRTRRASATSHSASRTSMPSSPACAHAACELVDEVESYRDIYRL
jgi:catechol 2,3-dioxygenase-like lactoylglutathione lyase family enzyme